MKSWYKNIPLGILLLWSHQGWSHREVSMQKEIESLEKHSMLYHAEILAKEFSGKATQWQHSYANPIYEAVSKKSSVWFTAYTLSTLTEPNQSTLQVLGSSELWKIFEEIGIQGIHTGPIRLAGGIQDLRSTPSTDGGFDRISYQIDQQFGTKADYYDLVKIAEKYGGIVIGDLVPGHTGRGADFELALRNYKNYPGIYHMVEIAEEDWNLLPHVAANTPSKNLSLSEVERLKDEGYIAGPLQNIIFKEPGIKDSNWDATGPVRGVDGKMRRWVYLHYFKANQPTLNWLDPTFAANQIIAGDVIVSLHHLKMQGIRLDANGFLGIEPIPFRKKAFSEGHPLSIVASDLIAMFIRKIGGFSFQELNLCLQSIKAFSEHGADFSYDFITRSAYCHALINQDAEFLKLMYRLMLYYDLQPVQLIHALQNHDEINFELAHFRTHSDETFTYHEKQISGSQLRAQILSENLEKISGRDTPYNFSSNNGPCTTMVGLCAAALKIKDISRLTESQKEQIQKAHLLLAFFNAMQPGIFAISGWDLVGAFPLEKGTIQDDYIGDGDYRWMHRGSYDLLGKSKQRHSRAHLPKAKELYGPLPKQMRDPKSFCRQLQKILKARKVYNLERAELIGVLDVYHPQLFVLMHQIPGTGNLQITAINFSQVPIEESLQIDQIKDCAAVDMIDRHSNPLICKDNSYPLKLGPLSGKVIMFQPRIVKN